MTVELLGFIDGVDFNVFFRGLLSVIAMFLVLCGASYLVLATNTGIRQGLLLAGAGFFSWMFLMGIIWTVYGTGWIGDAPTWDLLEIREGTLAEAETGGVSDLVVVEDDGEDAIDRNASAEEIEFAEDLLDAAEAGGFPLGQLFALRDAIENDTLNGWEFLSPAEPVRGDAQASVDGFLLEEQVFDSTNDYVPLLFGTFTRGGKPRIAVDASNIDRFVHWFDESIFTPLHSQELIVIQVQAAQEQFSLDGDVPPVTQVDVEAPVISVVMERDRGGSIPAVISGTRFTPLAFTFVSAIIFIYLCFLLHRRSQSLDAAVAAAAA